MQKILPYLHEYFFNKYTFIFYRVFSTLHLNYISGYATRGNQNKSFLPALYNFPVLFSAYFPYASVTQTDLMQSRGFANLSPGIWDKNIAPKFSV